MRLLIRDFTPEGAEPVELKAGGITIHHVRALHGSAPNTSDKPRRLMLAQYCAVDAWPLKGIPDWETFNDTIIRGEPTNQPRMVAAPVRMPEPYAELKAPSTRCSPCLMIRFMLTRDGS